MTRLAIIGAGVGGCAAAARAAQLGAEEVVILEASHPAAGSSGRSAGVYNVQTTTPLDIEIRIRARELFFRLERDRGLPLARIGNLRVARTTPDMDRLVAAKRVQEGFGIHDSQLLEADEIGNLVPDLEISDLVGGLYGPNDGHLDGHLLCAALLSEGREMGVRLLANSRVLDHRKVSCGTHELLVPSGTVRADVVINAAGPWAGRVAEMLGHSLPLVPQLHQVVRVKVYQPLSYVVPMVNLYMPGDSGEALYFRQDGPDSLIAGMHTYLVQQDLGVADPDNYPMTVSEEYLASVAEALVARFRVDELGFHPGWTGLYPLTSDGRFLVGPCGDDATMIACAGFGGVGITMGAIAGFVAAEWALLGRPVTVPTAESLVPGSPLRTPVRRGASPLAAVPSDLRDLSRLTP